MSKNFIINGLSELEQKKAFDPNNVKAVINEYDEVVYLSRKPLRNSQDSSDISIYLKQLGLYGFSFDGLKQFSSFEQTRLEKAESIEMLRWIETKNILSAFVLDTPSISVDTPEDLADVEEYMRLKK
jgi:3-deoxy-manno-octulosonate cytidylyltransferase (CMP-KDO synthetase)